MELDHEKGWIVNGKLQKLKNKYLSINKIIQNFLEINTSAVPQIKNLLEKQKTILLLPESQFNGNLDKQNIESLITKLTNIGYKVAINTNSDKYDYLLNDNVCKVFLSYRDTFDFAASCKAIIGVRSGLFDCLQECANKGVKCFVIYQNKHYPQYKFFKNFVQWFNEVYSFNTINKITIFEEFNEFNEFGITKIIKNIGG